MNLLYKWSNWKTWLVSILIFASFIGFILPDEAAESRAATGTSESPDGSFFYTADTLYSLAEQYGEEGRQHYVNARFTFDVIWPIAYFLFLTISIGILYRRTKWRWLILLPLAALLLDYLENISAATTIARYPATTPLLPHIATLFTMAKWSTIYLSFGLIIVGPIFWVRGKFRKNTS